MTGLNKLGEAAVWVYRGHAVSAIRINMLAVGSRQLVCRPTGLTSPATDAAIAARGSESGGSVPRR